MKRSPEDVWNTEYLAGRYQDEEPVAFVGDIVAAVRRFGLRHGLYIGCGNGRNYLPLVEFGLDLVGLDISEVAISKLHERAPDRKHRLVHGDLSVVPRHSTFPLVIGIQVFQHGDHPPAHAFVRAAQDLVAPGGLFCLRVNATGTDVSHAHEVIESSGDGGLTVRYLEGPKRDLDIHFFSENELKVLFSDEFEPVLPLSRDVTWREPRSNGQWSQWEGDLAESPRPVNAPVLRFTARSAALSTGVASWALQIRIRSTSFRLAAPSAGRTRATPKDPTYRVRSTRTSTSTGPSSTSRITRRCFRSIGWGFVSTTVSAMVMSSASIT